MQNDPFLQDQARRDKVKHACCMCKNDSTVDGAQLILPRSDHVLDNEVDKTTFDATRSALDPTRRRSKGSHLGPAVHDGQCRYLFGDVNDLSLDGLSPRHDQLRESLTQEDLQEKENMKKKLQEMVDHFIEKAVEGQKCEMVSPALSGGAVVNTRAVHSHAPGRHATMLSCPASSCSAVYSMDSNVKIFRVKPVVDKNRWSKLEIHMGEVHDVVGDPTMTTKYMHTRELLDVPDFLQRFVVLIHGPKSKQELGLLLPSADKREQFLTCMKILQRYVDLETHENSPEKR